MHAGKEIVHAEVSHEDGEEREEDVGVVETRTVLGDDGLVERDGVDHESDERPGLLRIP